MGTLTCSDEGELRARLRRLYMEMGEAVDVRPLWQIEQDIAEVCRQLGIEDD